MEEELKNMLSLHTATLEATADGILVVDLKGNVVSYNKRFLQLWRIPDALAEERNDDKLLAFVLEQLFSPEEFLAEVRRLYSQPDESSCDILKFRDGRIFERLSHPQKIEENIIGRVWSFRDITEHIKAEEKNTKLIEKVQSINSQLEDFAYIISHDLKAPLRGITTLANWISSDYADKLDQDGKEQLKLLIKRVDRMHNLIEGVLQYSRVGRVKEQKTQVNLNGLLPEIIDMICPPENITVSIDNTLPTIECERTRISQVFQNLLSNAIKCMDKVEGRIQISSSEDETCWTFSVADNGPGIDEKYFGKIFRIFQTLSAQDDLESTGVGLSLVKKIVELYEGKVWVESKVGQGSTFRFTLPKHTAGSTDEQ